MLIDTHVHLNDDAFKEDVEGVIRQGLAAGVELFFVPGWDLPSSYEAQELSHRYKEVYFMAGFQPENLDGVRMSDLNRIAELSDDPKCIAIGECGLDYHWKKDDDTKTVQKAFFLAQIELANRVGKPMSIHARDALEDTLELLSAVPGQAGAVLHCYSGSAEMLERFAKLGLYFGFDGPITFKNAVKPKEALAACPLDRLLLETDAPYMAPTPMRGKRNEPAFVRYVAEEAARIKNLPLREVEEKTTSNAFDLFHVKHD